MAMVTVKEFGRYDLGSLGLISNAAGIAETGMASERDDPCKRRNEGDST